MKRKKLKVVNKKKFTLFLLLIVMLVIAIISLFVKDNRVYSSTYEEKYIEVKVNRGDTLWYIAIDHLPDRYDVRKMIYEIMEFNDMEDASIQPGDLIKIPIN